MPTLHVTRGFPASGKTTWAEALCAASATVNINRDDIRRQLGIGQHGTDTQEDGVTAVQSALLGAALDNGSDIVLSDTNLRPRRLRPLLGRAVAAGYSVVVHDFRPGLGELLRRNAAREDSRRVPDSVIRDMWSRFPYRRWMPAGELVASATGSAMRSHPPLDDPRDLPHCVLVGLDGTLAHHNGLRSPHDWAMVGQDTVDEAVRDAVRDITAAGVRVIVMSGRDAVCRDATADWLATHGVPFDELYMRPAGDRRADWMVKDELVRTHIVGRYHVRYCLDGRQRVVDHYRTLGLKVFRVQQGNF